MNKNVVGVVAIFKDEHELLHAAKEARAKKNYRKYDAFTPYPVHGLDDAMGIKRSFLPWVTFIAGGAGLFAAIVLQVWTSAYDWPINIGGKPLISLPAFVPIMFELTVLIGGLSTVGALFVVCGLPNLRQPVLDPAITNDRFALFVPSNEPGFNSDDVRQFLSSLKPERVTVVEAGA